MACTIRDDVGCFCTCPVARRARAKRVPVDGIRSPVSREKRRTYSHPPIFVRHLFRRLRIHHHPSPRKPRQYRDSSGPAADESQAGARAPAMQIVHIAALHPKKRASQYQIYGKTQKDTQRRGVIKHTPESQFPPGFAGPPRVGMRFADDSPGSRCSSRRVPPCPLIFCGVRAAHEAQCWVINGA
jgi:hypothetical protein